MCAAAGRSAGLIIGKLVNFYFRSFLCFSEKEEVRLPASSEKGGGRMRGGWGIGREGLGIRYKSSDVGKSLHYIICKTEIRK